MTQKSLTWIRELLLAERLNSTLSFSHHFSVNHSTNTHSTSTLFVTGMIHYKTTEKLQSEYYFSS